MGDWFTWPTLYKDMIDKYPGGSSFVEVGVYLGDSLIYLIEKMIELDKDIKITGVDHFSGISTGLLEKFGDNTRKYSNKFTLIINKSVEAAKQFENKSLDFVFIDAAHEYKDVKNDIEAWLPKIKNGGIIAGHDYIPTYPGVMRAVNERFDNKVDEKYIFEGCWLVNIKENG